MFYEEEKIPNYDDPQTLQLDGYDSDEEAQLEEQRKIVRERIEQRKAAAQAVPAPQLHVDRVLFEFKRSEIEAETFDMIKDAWREEFKRRFYIPVAARQFSRVADGHERAELHTWNYSTLITQVPSVPVRVLSTVRKNALGALRALQQFESSIVAVGADQKKKKETIKQQQQQQGDADISWFLGDGISVFSLVVTFGQRPLHHYARNPEAISIPHPFNDVLTSEILLIAGDKERKKMYKQLLVGDKKALNIRVEHWDKLQKIYRNLQLKQKLADGYDFVFVDPQLHQTYALLDKPFFTKHPVPILLPESVDQWSVAIDKFISGTCVHIQRGVENISVQIGFAQMTASHLQSNLEAVLNELCKFLPGGFENVLYLELCSQKSPKLPIFVNNHLLESRFKVTKQFKKKVVVPQEDNETEEQTVDPMTD